MESYDWEPPTEAEMKLIEARRERSDKISKLMSGYLLKGYKMLAVVCAECETILLQDRQGIKYCVACSELDSDTDKDNPLINQSAAMSMVKEMELATSVALVSDTKTKGAAKSASQSLTQRNPSQAGAEARCLDRFSDSNDVATDVNVNTFDSQSRGCFKKEETGAASAFEVHAKKDTFIHGTDSDSGFPSLSESQLPSYLQQRKHLADTSHHTLASSSPVAAASLTISITRLLEKIDWASQELKDTVSIEYGIQLCQYIKTAAEAIVAVNNARK